MTQTCDVVGEFFLFFCPHFVFFFLFLPNLIEVPCNCRLPSSSITLSNNLFSLSQFIPFPRITMLRKFSIAWTFAKKVEIRENRENCESFWSRKFVLVCTWSGSYPVFKVCPSQTDFHIKTRRSWATLLCKIEFPSKMKILLQRMILLIQQCSWASFQSRVQSSYFV